MAKDKIMLKDGRIIEIPEDFVTITDKLSWLLQRCGKGSDMLISELEIFIPEINRSVHFLEDEDGMLVSKTNLSEEEYDKVKQNKWILATKIDEDKAEKNS